MIRKISLFSGKEFPTNFSGCPQQADEITKSS